MPEHVTGPAEDPRERLHAAQERRAKARSAGDRAGWVLAAYDCGQAHFDLGETDLPFARRLFAEAIQVIEESGTHRELLPGLLGMTGRALQRMKRWAEVPSWYGRAAEEAERQGLSAQQLRWLVKEATTTLDMNEAERGRTLLEQALEAGRAMLAAGQPVADPLSDALLRLVNLPSTDEEAGRCAWEEIDSLLAALPTGQAHFNAASNQAAWHSRHDLPFVAQTYLEEAIEISAAVGVGEQARLEVAMRLASDLRQRHEPVQACRHRGFTWCATRGCWRRVRGCARGSCRSRRRGRARTARPSRGRAPRRVRRGRLRRRTAHCHASPGLAARTPGRT